MQTHQWVSASKHTELVEFSTQTLVAALGAAKTPYLEHSDHFMGWARRSLVYQILKHASLRLQHRNEVVHFGMDAVGHFIKEGV